MATLAYSSPVAPAVAVVAVPGPSASASSSSSSSVVAGPSSPSSSQHSSHHHHHHHQHYPPLQQSSRQSQHHSFARGGDGGGSATLSQTTAPVISNSSSSSSSGRPGHLLKSASTESAPSPTAAVQADARKRALQNGSSICDSSNSGNNSNSSKSSLGSNTPNYILINKLRIQEQANARAAAKAAAVAANKSSPTATSTAAASSSSLASQLSFEQHPNPSTAVGGHNSIGSRTRLLLRSAANSVPPNASSSVGASHYNSNSSRPVVTRVTAQDWLNGGGNQRNGGNGRDAAMLSYRRPSAASTATNKVITSVAVNRPSSISSSPCTSLQDHPNLHHRSCQQSSTSSSAVASGRVVVTKSGGASVKETSPPRPGTKTVCSSVRPSLSVKSISSSRTTAAIEQQQQRKQFLKQTSVTEQRLEQANTVQLHNNASDELTASTTTATKRGETGPKSELQKCDTITAAVVATNAISTGTVVDQPSSNATTATENGRLSRDKSSAENGSKSQSSSSAFTSRTASCDNNQPQSSSEKQPSFLSPSPTALAATGALRRGQLLFRNSRGLASSGRDNAPADVDMLRLASANSRRAKRQQQQHTATTSNGQTTAKTATRSKPTSKTLPNSNLLAFIEKSSPELIFLLSESAKLSYHLCQFEAKLDYLEQIFCRKAQFSKGQSSAEVVAECLENKNNGQKSSSLLEHQNDSNKGSWSSVIKRTRNWIDGVRSKNVLLEKRPAKKGSKTINRMEQKLANKKRPAPHMHQTENVTVDENDSSSSVHSSEDELILLLDRIIKFSSNIVSRLNPNDLNDQPLTESNTKVEEKLDSTENVITKCDSEGTSDDTTTVVSEKRNTVLKMRQLSSDSDTINNNNNKNNNYAKLSTNNNNSNGDKSDQSDSIVLNETLSSLSAESIAKGRFEWLQSLPSNVKDLMEQLFPVASSNNLSSTEENTDPNTTAANFERIYELNPELLKALIENVKTNARLVQLRREFDRLMCSHLKAIGHEVKGSSSGKGKKSSSAQKSSTPAKRKKANEEGVKTLEKSPFRDQCTSKFTTISNGCCQQQQQQPEQLNSSESNKSNHSNHCHCQPNQSHNQTHHLMVSDGDSGGEFTATTVTNDFGPTNNATTTNAAIKASVHNSNSNSSSTVNTDDELSSLLNQIAVCSAKIIEQQQQSSSGGLAVGSTNGVASCSSNNSNSTSSSSGCCCSSASLLDGSAGGINGGVATGKCASSNSLTGSGGPLGGHNGWSNHSQHQQHHQQHHLSQHLHFQSPPHSVQLKKSNMRHNSGGGSSTNMLSAAGCNCESTPKHANSPLYLANHQQQLLNRSVPHHHWSQSSIEELDSNYQQHQLHSSQLYGSRANVAALKRSTGMTALNEAASSVGAPFTLADHMTGFMFAPSAMDLLSAASCSSVVVPPSVGVHHPTSISHSHLHHPHHNQNHHLGHYRHHSSSGVFRGAQLQTAAAFSSNVDHSNLHYAQQQPPLYSHHMQNHLTGEPELSANAFIFDPNVDVESFLNEVEKELDDNCYASAPPFMARTTASQHLPPTMAGGGGGLGHNGLVDGTYVHLSPHRYFSSKTSQHLNQIGNEQHYLQQHQHQLPHSQQQQTPKNHLSSTPTLVNSKQLQGNVYSSLNTSPSNRSKAVTISGFSPMAQTTSSSSSSSANMMAGGNWRLKASTLDLANSSNASSSGSSHTITNNANNISPNTIGSGNSTTTSHFPFPSTASMPLTNAELLRGITNNNSFNLSSSGGNLVAPSSPGESQRYKRLIVPSASRDLLDNFRAQVSHRVAAETDSQLRQVEQWFQEQVQASMGARQTALAGSMAPESTSESSLGGGSHHQQQFQHSTNNNQNSNILLAADRRRFSADYAIKQNNANNNDLIYFN